MSHVVHNLMTDDDIISDGAMRNKCSLGGGNNFLEDWFEPRSKDLGDYFVAHIAKIDKTKLVNFVSPLFFRNQGYECLVNGLEGSPIVEEILDN